MNRRQRDQNRGNALRLHVMAEEHVLYPEYPNYISDDCDSTLSSEITGVWVDEAAEINAALAATPSIFKEDTCPTST